MEPPNEEVAKRRSDLAREYGKYGFEARRDLCVREYVQCFVVRIAWAGGNPCSGNIESKLATSKWPLSIKLEVATGWAFERQVGSIQSRVVRGNEVLYEVQWKGRWSKGLNTSGEGR